jgi:hypothetical protein
VPKIQTVRKEKATGIPLSSKIIRRPRIINAAKYHSMIILEFLPGYELFRRRVLARQVCLQVVSKDPSNLSLVTFAFRWPLKLREITGSHS